MHHLHPRPRAGGIQRRQQVRARLEPQRLLRDLPRHHHRRTLAAPAAGPAPVRQLPQGPLHQLPQCYWVGELSHRQAAAGNPAAERLLPRSVLPVDQLRWRDARHRGVGVQHEHQPVQARLRRGIEFQLGVGHPRRIPHFRPVPGAQDPHVHIAARHPFPAQVRGDLVRGREIGHVHDHVPAGRHRPLGRRHVRAPRRELPQLRGMRQEHPPAAASSTARPGHPSHLRSTPAHRPGTRPGHTHPAVQSRSQSVTHGRPHAPGPDSGPALSAKCADATATGSDSWPTSSRGSGGTRIA